MPWLLRRLEDIAPVLAVKGNCDTELTGRATEILELAGCRILLQHQVDPRQPGDILKQRLIRHQPRLVVFGHTHRRFSLMQEGIAYVNPGYAGEPRLHQARSVALLQWDGLQPEVRFLELP
jgi:putative phosphoesterase